MKKLLLVIAVLMVAVVVALFVGLSNLGPLIKQGVNTQGPKITGTELRVGDVDIALFSGQAKLQNFLLGNPQGFTSPHAVAVKSIYVDIDESSLTGETIVIDKIEVVGPDIFYEKSAGSDNFQALQNNIRRGSGGGGSASPAQNGKAGKKLLIRELVIRGGQVHLAMKGLAGQEIKADLADIRLQNIGGKKGGVLPAEAIREIVTALYGKISSPDVKGVLNQGLLGLQGDAEQLGQKAVEQAGEKAAGEVEKKLKGLLGN